MLADGARWSWTLAAEHFGARGERGDCSPASEPLWPGARRLESAGTAGAQPWGAARGPERRHDGGAGVRPARRAARAPTADGRQLLRRERAYFRTNAARMDAPAAKAAGRPIGSGAGAALARPRVQLRLKRPGARWSRAGAQAILTLRAHLASGRPLPRGAQPPAPPRAPRVA